MLRGMDWITLSIVSAALLGVYDAAKKLSVHHNAVPIVLLCCVSIGAVVYLPAIIWSHLDYSSVPLDAFRIESLSWERHLLVFAKSVLVGASWTLAFHALKELPLSIAAPIRATSPFWTIVIATLFFAERPTAMQWIGIGHRTTGILAIHDGRQARRHTLRSQQIGVPDDGSNDARRMQFDL